MLEWIHSGKSRWEAKVISGRTGRRNWKQEENREVRTGSGARSESRKRKREVESGKWKWKWKVKRGGREVESGKWKGKLKVDMEVERKFGN